MASGDLRAELKCSICLNIYTDPVMLRCGHNFCRVCIDRALDTQEGSGGYSCPVCRKSFRSRSALQRNITLRNIAETFLSPQSDREKSGVFCTYCVDSPVPAVRSCLHCEVSLCDKHLRVHKKSPEHVLCDPTLSMESRKCSVHKKILVYYCTEDETCICISCCMIGEHKGHKMKSLDEASEKKKEPLRNVLQKLLTKREKTEERVQSLQEHRRKVEEEAAGDTERVTALFRDLRRRLEDLEKRALREISGRAERISISIRDLEIKKEELSRKLRHIEELCNVTDPLTVLQESDTGDLCDTEDGDNEDRERHEELLHDGGGLDVAGVLQKGLSDIITEVNVYFPIQRAADILLDVNTAHNYLQISDDRKTVSMADIEQNYPETPERFRSPQVLSSRSFSSGRHYWEVDVGGADGWRVGMCYPSMERRGGESLIGRNKKSWGLERDNNQYKVTHDREMILLPPNPSSNRVRIYLDYEAGRISFYDLGDPIRHLHTFTTTFTEPLHAGIYVWRGCIKICGGRRLKAIGERVSHTEDKMGEFATAHNELVDAHNEAEDEIQAIKSKMADLEDRNRRNDVKLRGVTEDVLPADLRKYVQKFIATLLPEILEGEVIVDRAHRLPKPKHLPDKVPRDVIAPIHFFHVKEDLMRFSRNYSPLPDPYADISVYSDISQYTMQARRNLAMLTKHLQNHKIPYTWGFPTKILVTKDNKTFVITNLENGLKLARQWQLLPEENSVTDALSRFQWDRFHQLAPEAELCRRTSPLPHPHSSPVSETSSLISLLLSAMASGDLRAELECSVCLNIYTNPVMLRCGHNFCRVCIDRVLDTQEGSEGFSCPECREKFPDRPALQKNKKLCNIVETFLSTQLDREESGVLCTYCVDSPVPAVRSCLHCEVSLCDKHLRVHKKSPEHVLCDPTLSMESRKCSVHKKILEYYCTEDETCICVSCSLAGEHRGHQVETLGEASEKKKETLRSVLQKLLTKREETEERVQSLQEHRRKVEKEAAGDTKRVTALFRDLRRRLKELEKRVLRDISGRAERISISIRDLEIKKEELSRKLCHLEELCNVTDPLTVLQESDTGDLCDTEDGDNEDRERHEELLNDGGGLDVAGVLHTGLSDIITEVNVYYIQGAADILLDGNTAHNDLQISDDRKTVSWSDIEQNHPETPERFQDYPQVMSSQRFSSGRHYWEVNVGGSGWWRVGMCYPSIERRGVESWIAYNKKSWGLERYRNQYSVIHDRKETPLPTNPSSNRVRIDLDYEAGRISFYDLCDPIRHLHTFTTTFTEPLHAGIGVWRGCIKICGGRREM
ncbi:uncharacterized protein LOC143981418 [Lithobates pipiens]